METKDLEQTEKRQSEEFLDGKREWRRLFAEAWGTFLLVVVACGSSIAGKQYHEVTAAMQAIASGATVMIVIYFLGEVSGAHINPAVTVAFALRRNFPWKRVPLYVIVQFAGGIAAVAFLEQIFGRQGDLGATVPAISPLKAFALETLLTTGLVNVILGTATGPRNIGKNGGIAIGSYVAVAGLWAGPVSGASMNPVRSLAPDIMRSDYSMSWIYVLSTLLGCVLAVCFEWLIKGKPSAAASKEAQGTGGN